MAHALPIGLDVGVYGRLAPCEPLLELAALAEAAGLDSLLIGGTSRAALQRVARLGDGWISTGLHPARLQERLKVLRTLCAAVGRPFGALSLTHKVFINIGEARYDADGQRDTGTGMLAEILADLRRLVDLGYGGIMVRYRGSDAAAPRTQV